MFASTRLPMPAVSVSASFCTKSAWIEYFFAPEDRRASELFTLFREVWIVAIIADALACVETVAVVAIVTIEPDNDMFSAFTVMRRVPSEDAKAVILVVEPSTR